MKDKKYSAITMLETVVYLALFAVLFLVMIYFYFNVGTANNRASTQLSNQRVSLFLSEHFDHSIEESDGIDYSASSFGQNNSILRFSFGGSYKEYYLDNGILYLTDGSEDTRLTPASSYVKRFRVDVSRDESQQLYAIKIRMTYGNLDISNTDEELILHYISK